MSNIEFLNYLPTPSEKHLGIATVKMYGKIILRYKIVPMKDGNGFFPTPASYKITDENGERYVPAFMLDSNFEKDELETLIKANIRRYMTNGTSIVSNAVKTAQIDVGGVHTPDDNNFPF